MDICLSPQVQDALNTERKNSQNTLETKRGITKTVGRYSNVFHSILSETEPIKQPICVDLTWNDIKYFHPSKQNKLLSRSNTQQRVREYLFKDIMTDSPDLKTLQVFDIRTSRYVSWSNEEILFQYHIWMLNIKFSVKKSKQFLFDAILCQYWIGYQIMLTLWNGNQDYIKQKVN